MTAGEPATTQGRDPAAVKGYVYVFHSPGTGLTKIGFSKHPTSRYHEIRAHCPDIVYDGDVGSPDPRWLERYLHVVFAEYREHGEWFRLPAEERQSLLSLPAWAGSDEDMPAPFRIRFAVNDTASATDTDGWLDARVRGRFMVLERLVLHLSGSGASAPGADDFLRAEVERLLPAADQDTRNAVAAALSRLDQEPFSPPPKPAK